jgi:CheY-like chemotaxis protein
MVNRGLPGAGPIRVAIVEDDVLLRDGLRLMLNQAEGLCCEAACSSVAEALEILKGCPADVLLLDIGLPGMAGSDAVPVFRQALAQTIGPSPGCGTVYSDQCSQGPLPLYLQRRPSGATQLKSNSAFPAYMIRSAPAHSGAGSPVIRRRSRERSFDPVS